MFTVIEHTIGYLPEDDDPPLFEDYADAVEYMNERARWYEEDCEGQYAVTYGIASSDNYAACEIVDTLSVHPLPRYIEVIHEDDGGPDSLILSGTYARSRDGRQIYHSCHGWNDPSYGLERYLSGESWSSLYSWRLVTGDEHEAVWAAYHLSPGESVEV